MTVFVMRLLFAGETIVISSNTAAAILCTILVIKKSDILAKKKKKNPRKANKYSKSDIGAVSDSLESTTIVTWTGCKLEVEQISIQS